MKHRDRLPGDKTTGTPGDTRPDISERSPQLSGPGKLSMAHRPNCADLASFQAFFSVGGACCAALELAEHKMAGPKELQS
jgi:hypothetical protein